MNSVPGMDYLHALAARSLGVSDGIRPRLPSRFEPTPLEIAAEANVSPAQTPAQEISARPADRARQDFSEDVANDARARVAADPVNHVPRRQADQNHRAPSQPLSPPRVTAEITPPQPRQVAAAQGRNAPLPTER